MKTPVILLACALGITGGAPAQQTETERLLEEMRRENRLRELERKVEEQRRAQVESTRDEDMRRLRQRFEERKQRQAREEAARPALDLPERTVPAAAVIAQKERALRTQLAFIEQAQRTRTLSEKEMRWLSDLIRQADTRPKVAVGQGRTAFAPYISPELAAETKMEIENHLAWLLPHTLRISRLYETEIARRAAARLTPPPSATPPNENRIRQQEEKLLRDNIQFFAEEQRTRFLTPEEVTEFRDLIADIDDISAILSTDNPFAKSAENIQHAKARAWLIPYRKALSAIHETEKARRTKAAR